MTTNNPENSKTPVSIDREKSLQALRAMGDFNRATTDTLVNCALKGESLKPEDLFQIQQIFLWNIARFLEETGLTKQLIEQAIPEYQKCLRNQGKNQGNN